MCDLPCVVKSVVTVEVEGMLNQKPISILIDPGAILSYVSPSLVEKSKLPVENLQSHGWFN